MEVISFVLRFAISAAMSVIVPFGSWLGLAWNSATPLKDLSRLRVSNGNSIVMERGFVLQGWTYSEAVEQPSLSPGDFAALGFGPTFFDGNLFYAALLEAEPDLLWSLAKAPDESANGLAGTRPTGAEWLSAEQLQHLDRLVSVCFGDEQAYDDEEAAAIAAWIMDFRSRHPDVLLHTNQYNGQWSKKQIAQYLRESKPDILTFDNYYFNAGNMERIKYHAMPAMIADKTNEFRIPAMGGHDGSGEEPIPFGQYLQCFDCCCVGWYTVSESQKNLVANLTATMGGKWLNLFRLPLLVMDGDGTLTRHFYEYAEIGRELQNLSAHLAGLQTVDVRVVPGQHKWWRLTLDNPLPKTVNAFKRGSAPYIETISVKNLSGENDGLPGDVYVGSFAILPGTANQNREYFAVCNALTAGNGLKDEGWCGSCDETQQEITLRTDGKQTKTLYYVDSATGQEVPVVLDNGSAAFTLGGGKMRLFFWE